MNKLDKKSITQKSTRLKSLSLSNFRSYEEAEFGFGSNINLLLGPNGSGKTNILESIYVLALSKSFRAKDMDLVRQSAEFFRVAADVGDSISIGYQNSPTGSSKKFFVGSKNIPVKEYIGRIKVVLFEPEDLKIVGGPPEKRRNLLDGLLSQISGEYLQTLLSYRRVLRQRNSLLVNFQIGGGQNQIFAWDLKLTELAGKIYQARQNILGELQARLPKYYADMAGADINIDLKYVPSFDMAGDYTASFLDRLTANLPKDLAAGFTTIGPHREDFTISFDGRPAETVASRGEVRTLVLAIKLAELAILGAPDSCEPIFLLDDVFSELDAARRLNLLARLDGIQVIITATEADDIAPHLPSSTHIINIGRS